MILTLIVFFIILSVLVIIHELGHYSVAKKFGVRVEEFGFGLPPKLLGKKYGETEYTLNALPFGGFVRLTGEDIQDAHHSFEEAKKDPRNFMSKSPLKRAAVVVAGVIMNVLLALVLYYVFFLNTGFRSFTFPMIYDYWFRFGQNERYSTVVLGYAPVSPAYDAGIIPGEAVLEINGQQVFDIEDITSILTAIPVGENVNLLLIDLTDFDRQVRGVTLTLTENAEGKGSMGAVIGSATSLNYQNNKFLSSPMHAYNVMGYTVFAIKSTIRDSINQKDIGPISESVSGPVGIYSVIGSIVQSDQNKSIVLLSLIDIVALLSLSLAFLNILPFPALDGGRLVFIIIEGVTKKPVSYKIETFMHKAGMVFLLLFILLITIKDIINLI